MMQLLFFSFSFSPFSHPVTLHDSLEVIFEEATKLGLQELPILIVLIHNTHPIKTLIFQMEFSQELISVTATKISVGSGLPHCLSLSNYMTL